MVHYFEGNIAPAAVNWRGHRHDAFAVATVAPEIMRAERIEHGQVRRPSLLGQGLRLCFGFYHSTFQE